MESKIGKIFKVSDIFGVKNVTVQTFAGDGCMGCYFRKLVFPYCFKPAYIGDCEENGMDLIFKEIKEERND